MSEQVSSDNSNTIFERISLLEDMRMEYDQQSILQAIYANTVPLEVTAVVRSIHTPSVLIFQYFY